MLSSPFFSEFVLRVDSLGNGSPGRARRGWPSDRGGADGSPLSAHHGDAPGDVVLEIPGLPSTESSQALSGLEVTSNSLRRQHHDCDPASAVAAAGVV